MSILDISEERISDPVDILEYNIRDLVKKYFGTTDIEIKGIISSPADKLFDCQPFDCNLLDFKNLQDYILVYKVVDNKINLWIMDDELYTNKYINILVSVVSRLRYRINLQWVLQGNINGMLYQ
mgnify:CR=1 FL=1